MSRRNRSRDELILAFSIYCKTPFGKLHERNPDVIELAKLIDRSPGAVAWKLVNFASFDPALAQRDIAGASHASKADKTIWDEFHGDWDRLSFESEQLRSHLAVPVPKHETRNHETWPAGQEREAPVRIRVNQAFFRSTVLAAYVGKCCITGLAVPELLNASHIVPWSTDDKNRTNPRNGLCLNVLHDRMFDRGLITITPDYVVKVSKRLKRKGKLVAIEEQILACEGRSIQLPEKFWPDRELLYRHTQETFVPE